MPRVTISEPGSPPQPYRFKLERKIVKIGRGSENDIVIECPSASTHHCKMARVKGGYTLSDKDSTNGIKLEGLLMEVIDLFDGMEVFIGDVPLKFQLSDEEIKSLGKEASISHQRKKIARLKKTDEEQPRQSEAGVSPSPASTRREPTVQKSGGGLKIILIIIFILIAIGVGMTLSHLKRTGDFLPTKLMDSGAKGSPSK